MDSSGSKSNQKRQRENENGSGPPQRKSPRLLAKNQPPSQPPSMTITDMNDDCLEEIFMHLDLVSLFNVAVANEWLRPAARIVYKRRFRVVPVHINDGGIFTSTAEPHEVRRYIVVRGSKNRLQYLRCFGSSIRKLIIWYPGMTSEQCEHIHRYINKYCTESLECIVFMHKPIDVTINQLEKPFANIRMVKVHCGNLGHQLASFPHWFPNLEFLRLSDTRMENSGIMMPFDHLKHLDLTYGNVHYVSIIKNVCQLLKLCRRLESLRICVAEQWGRNMTQLLDLIKDNQAIRTLIVSAGGLWKDVKLLEAQQLAEKFPTMRALDLPNYMFTADSAITLIRQLGSLRKIRLGMWNALECDRFVDELNAIGGWQHSSYTDFQNHRLIVLNR